MKISIDAHIRSNLNSRRGSWAELARQSGVSYSWLSKFARGLIENPGLRTLERLSSAMNNSPAPAARSSFPVHSVSEGCVPVGASVQVGGVG